MSKENLNRLPRICPSCSNELDVIKLQCDECGSTVEGMYRLSMLALLDELDQKLVIDLIKASGSLKDVARQYGISYPTMRNRVDLLIERIKFLESTTNSSKE